MSQVAHSKSKSMSARRLAADSFSRSVLLLGFLLVMQRGIGFLRSFYVCGTLSPAEVGQWDLAFNFLVIVAPLAVFGIPGSFGRYVPRYEQRGQQNKFLRQTLIACIGLTALASTLIWMFREQVAQYFFGSSEDQNLVTILSVGLPAVVLFNFATSWFTGKRFNRAVFRIQFSQTVFFAVLCFLFFQIHSVTAAAVVLAYLLSCLVGILLAASYAPQQATPPGERLPSHTESDSRDAIWRKILPFAIWVWVSNALVNLFSVCGRLLLVNFHPQRDVDVQSLIGQYHTALLIPLLLVSVGEMAASMLIPYSSKDWESGNRQAVTERMNLMLKAIGLLCMTAAVAILLVAPLLFGGLWKDKFAVGESLLPMTLSYCSLIAMTFVAQTYFWCIEKTHYSSINLLLGLAVNVSLGLALIGRFGIEGVVAATLVAHIVVLTGIFVLCRRHGLKLDAGVFLVAAALLAISLGKGIALVSMIALLLVAVLTEAFLNRQQKQKVLFKLKSFL